MGERLEMIEILRDISSVIPLYSLVESICEPLISLNIYML